MSANKNMSSRTQQKTGGKRDNRGGNRGRGRGRGRGRDRGRGGRGYNNSGPIRKVPEKPMTPMEKLKATNMSAYVRIIQAKRISDMEQKYIEDQCSENPKFPYMPTEFTRKGNYPTGDKIRRELGELGWNYQDGNFLHPYTTAEVHNVHEQLCDGGRILVPGYDLCMDEKGVSSNIMNIDNMPQYFSENTYVTRLSKGGSMTYNIEQHEFVNFWEDTRRGKRTEKRYRYLEGRKRRKEEFVRMRVGEEQRQLDYEEAKKMLRM